MTSRTIQSLAASLAEVIVTSLMINSPMTAPVAKRQKDELAGEIDSVIKDWLAANAYEEGEP